MSETSGEGADQQPKRTNGSESEEPLWTAFYEDSGYRPAKQKRNPEPPNWVEKGTLIALILTLVAAGIAAYEADRLAADTETAIADARKSSNDNADQTATLYAAWGQFAAAMNRQAANTHDLVGQAKSSATSARTSATAAQGQLGEMQAEQRPLVTVSSATVEILSDKRWRIAPHIENTGNTPVRALEYAHGESTGPVFEGAIHMTPGSYQMRDLWLGITDPQETFDGPFTKDHFPLGPKASHPDFIGNEYSKPSDLSQFGPGSVCRLIAYGVIHYSDFAKPPGHHVTKYCYAIQGIKINGTLEPRYQFCPYWNCTDEECKADKAAYDKQEPIAKSVDATIPKPWVGTHSPPCTPQ